MCGDQTDHLYRIDQLFRFGVVRIPLHFPHMQTDRLRSCTSSHAQYSTFNTLTHVRSHTRAMQTRTHVQPTPPPPSLSLSTCSNTQSCMRARARARVDHHQNTASTTTTTPHYRTPPPHTPPSPPPPPYRQRRRRNARRRHAVRVRVCVIECIGLVQRIKADSGSSSVIRAVFRFASCGRLCERSSVCVRLRVLFRVRSSISV